MQTHRDLAGSSLDQSDDRRVAVARRHEVDQCDPPVLGAEAVSSTMVPSRYARLTCGAGSAGWMRHRPWSEVPSRAAKHTAVEARPTQPVDGPVTANESGARAVSDQCVVFDGERQVGLRGCVGSSALRGNDVRLLVLQSPPAPRDRGVPSPGACNTGCWTSTVAIVVFPQPETPVTTRIVRTSPISG